MKTKIFAIICLLTILIGCTDENTIQNETSIEATSILEIVQNQENSEPGIAITVEQLKEVINDQNQNRAFVGRQNCAQEIITVYWNGAAETDFTLRQQIRENFMLDHGLDNFIRSYPETEEIDYELWVFYDEDGHPCHTQGVEANVNSNGGGQVNTDDE